MVRTIIERCGMGLVLAAMSIVIAVQSPVFLTGTNLLNVLLQVSINTIIAVGMTFVILTAGIDLSVGAMAAFSAVVLGLVAQAGGSAPVAVAAGLLAGAGCGSINGFLVARCRVPAFIATLGMMSVARGAALAMTGGKTLYQLPQGICFLGAATIGPIPVPVIIAVAAVLGAWYVLGQTRFGRYIYAVGGNREASRLAGIRVVRVEIGVYIISGLMSGLGACVLVGRLGAAQPIAGYGYEMSAIAATIIGGTSLMGGDGGVFQTLIGALLIGILQNGLTLLNVSPYMQQIIVGAVIVVAVLVDRVRQRANG